jgi:hypothetical protein
LDGGGGGDKDPGGIVATNRRFSSLAHFLMLPATLLGFSSLLLDNLLCKKRPEMFKTAARSAGPSIKR